MGVSCVASGGYSISPPAASLLDLSQVKLFFACPKVSSEGRADSTKGPAGPAPEDVGDFWLRSGRGRARLFPVRVDEEETELEAVGEAELAEDGGQVGLDRSFPDLEPGRNLFVRGAGADQECDLPLAPREQIQPAVGLRQTLGLLLGVLRVLLEEPRDQLALGPDLTVMDAVH